MICHEFNSWLKTRSDVLNFSPLPILFICVFICIFICLFVYAFIYQCDKAHFLHLLEEKLDIKKDDYIGHIFDALQFLTSIGELSYFGECHVSRILLELQSY